jgi:hypothetical protein
VDIEKIEKAISSMLPKETIHQVYKDALQPFAQAIGKLGGDSGKCLRLLTLPIQGLAFTQDWIDLKRMGGLKRMAERMVQRVPEESRIEAQPEIVGPSLEHMLYLPSDKSELWQMFEEVLTKSIDEDHVDEVHPSFPKIIAQLSRDEAWLLYRLRGKPLTRIYVQRLFSDITTKQTQFTPPSIEFELDELPYDKLICPQKFNFYAKHLESMGLTNALVHQSISGQTEDGAQWGSRCKNALQLTEFGELFAKACIPEKGFETLKGEE